mmetsp:Transcript_64321/g.172161  ORF Transcript_64321/g.172161 Transcript_64321/m.172161 type:complete len:204 (-) Transcript_64321:265-876(-)
MHSEVPYWTREGVAPPSTNPNAMPETATSVPSLDKSQCTPAPPPPPPPEPWARPAYPPPPPPAATMSAPPPPPPPAATMFAPPPPRAAVPDLGYGQSNVPTGTVIPASVQHHNPPNYPPHSMQYGQQQANPMQQQYYYPQQVHPVMPPMQATQVEIRTRRYCGPATWALGIVLCFFTGAGCCVACCPCDIETVTYVNGRREKP